MNDSLASGNSLCHLKEGQTEKNTDAGLYYAVTLSTLQKLTVVKF